MNLKFLQCFLLYLFILDICDGRFRFNFGRARIASPPKISFHGSPHGISSINKLNFHMNMNKDLDDNARMQERKDRALKYLASEHVRTNTKLEERYEKIWDILHTKKVITQSPALLAPSKNWNKADSSKHVHTIDKINQPSAPIAGARSSGWNVPHSSEHVNINHGSINHQALAPPQPSIGWNTPAASKHTNSKLGINQASPPTAGTPSIGWNIPHGPEHVNIKHTSINHQPSAPIANAHSHGWIVPDTSEHVNIKHGSINHQASPEPSSIGWNAPAASKHGDNKLVTNQAAPIPGTPSIGWNIPHTMNHASAPPIASSINRNVPAASKHVNTKLGTNQASAPISDTPSIGWNIPHGSEHVNIKHATKQPSAPPASSIDWNVYTKLEIKPALPPISGTPSINWNIPHRAERIGMNRNQRPVVSSNIQPKQHNLHGTSNLSPVGSNAYNYQLGGYQSGSFKPTSSLYQPQQHYLGYHPGGYSGYGRSYTPGTSVHYGPVTYINGYQAPIYSYYHDRSDNSLLSLYMGYTVGQMFSHAHSTYFPSNTYTVHHYHHGNKQETFPEKISVEANTIINCGENITLLCIDNTTPMCLSNGTIFCVTSPKLTVPCEDNTTVSCVTSLIKCDTSDLIFNEVCEEALDSLNSTTQNSNTLNVPCISSMDVVGNSTEFNSSEISNHTKTSDNLLQKNTTILTQNFTKTELKNNITSPDYNNSIAQTFCVIVIAVPTPIKFINSTQLQDPELHEKTWELATNILDHLWTG